MGTVRNNNNGYTAAQLAEVANLTSAEDKVKELGGVIAFPSSKALIAIRFDDNSETVYTNAYPLLLERGLVSTLALVANKLGTWAEQPKLTDANVITMAQNGNEIGNHSYNHLDTPANATEWEYEIGAAKTKMETDYGYSCFNFIKPGSWATMPTRDMPIGKYLMQNYPYYEGYDGDKYTSRPNERRFAYTHDTGDDQTLVRLKEKIDIICAEKLSMIMMFHWVGYEGMGISTADFTSFLDYIVEKRDAGLLENVTDLGLMAARVGEPKNILTNGSFEALANSGFPTLFNIVGTPTVESAAPHSTTNAITCTSTNYIRRINAIITKQESDSETYRLTCYHKTPTTGTARFIVQAKNLAGDNVFSLTKSMVSTTDYQRFDMTFQLPKGLVRYLNIYFQPSAGTSTCADMSLIRIG